MLLLIIFQMSRPYSLVAWGQLPLVDGMAEKCWLTPIVLGLLLLGACGVLSLLLWIIRVKPTDSLTNTA